MLRLLSFIFTWWNGPGLGTRLTTWRTGNEVGRDDQGNVYYGSKPAKNRVERRWVIYNGAPEASRIPPEWSQWLHKTVDVVPTAITPRIWEKPWVPNLTGTSGAHAPSGALSATGKRARATGDYEAWTPE